MSDFPEIDAAADAAYDAKRGLGSATYVAGHGGEIQPAKYTAGHGGEIRPAILAELRRLLPPPAEDVQAA